MLTQTIAEKIGHDWVEKWNQQQLHEYSLLYEENAEETSTIANRLIQISHGTIRGKDILIPYWQFFRTRFPDYQFKFLHSNIYQDSILIYFTIDALNSPAIAKIDLNEEMKIQRVMISHV
jgi:hypothetical protein